ncbi:hypothetical protein PN499_26770 [Kamptonema animale CS-326]|jgi:hypothetical protein|uniref:beta strand repeat-containing protein n=1 Tax=Kamptonema animale TaxID=92934 RepID=UPI0023314758|nr:hypothetical protein [Kamptonema animale]MDB9514810.1 hypothetical protein [Kamptonema animale CS-326]
MATYTVTNTLDSGAGSLREAITIANGTVGVSDIIQFSIGAVGSTQTINLLSGLPAITDTLTIDGWTQGGGSYTGPPPIELNGTSVPLGNFGLIIQAGNSVVRGLTINRFPTNAVLGNAFGIGVFAGSNSWIYGNYIGTNLAGTTAQPNYQGGIWVGSGATGTRIGTDGDGVNDTAERNLISGNGGASGVGARLGIFIEGSGTVVAGNYIGTNAAGTGALGNSGLGVYILNANNVTIGGSTPALRNIISSNGSQAIQINGATATSNSVQGNYIGTDVTGTVDLGNTSNGVLILGGASNNFIGSNGDGVNDAAEGNLIANNDRQGNTINTTNGNVRITGTGTNNNTIAANLIGLQVGGTTTFPISGGPRGVLIDNGPQNNIIGGVTAATRNVIGGQQHTGVEIAYTSNNNRVVGNYIGLGTDGTTPVSNNIGVQIYTAGVTGPQNNLIGGSAAAERNIISGNRAQGVIIFNTTSTNNSVIGNYIGTDASGTVDRGNGLDGVFIQNAPNNIIGGSNVGDRNIISGNNRFGVVIFAPAATGNSIRGNYIGTDVSGSADLGNSADGIYIQDAPNNLIGGSNAGDRNVLSGNGRFGVLIQSGSNNNQVLGNYIGTQADGITSLKNDSSGVRIDSPSNNNLIGGINSGEGNTIAYNGDRGVNILGGTGNSIRGNSIFSNTNLGIDLNNDGITLNDTNDADTGANNLQNFPVLTAVSGNIVSGTINSIPNTTFRVEFFANSAYNALGAGEGQTYLGFQDVTTDSAGNGAIAFTYTPVTGQILLSATATNTTTGDTSELLESIGALLLLPLLQNGT